MWHIAAGLGILITVISLLCIGMYKLSGTNNICKRGQWADTERDQTEDQLPVGPNGNVEWLELQVNNLEPIEEVSNSTTIDAGG